MAQCAPVTVTPRSCLVAFAALLFFACPEKPPPPVAPAEPQAPAQPPQVPAQPEPAAPAVPAEPPPKAKAELNMPFSPDGGALPEEAMPPWSKVELGDFVVYDVETTRRDPGSVFRAFPGDQPPVNARLKLTVTAVDKTGATVDVRFVPSGPNTNPPRWLESGLSVKMLPGTPRPRGQPVTDGGVLALPPKTPLLFVSHAGQQYKCRYSREEAPTPEGQPARRCVGSPDRALILGSGVVYADGVKAANGNTVSLVLVEAGKVKADPPGPLAFEDNVPIVTREAVPMGERLVNRKVSAAGGQVKTEETVHQRAASGQAAALTFDGANWGKPETRKLSEELVEWVAGLFNDDVLLPGLPDDVKPGAAVVFGATRIETSTVGYEAPPTDSLPARTYRWLIPARPTALKVAPIWIRYGSVELNVHAGDAVWKRRVVSYQK